MQANVAIDRRAALREITEKIDSSLSTGEGLSIPDTLFKEAGFTGLPTLEKVQEVSQIVRAISGILEAFEDHQQIDYLTLLETPDGVLDLLVKFFPARVNFAIALRSQGGATITYREDKQALYRRSKKGVKPWTPDHVHRLNEQEFYLRKYKNHLLGSSSRQRCRPIVKLFVLTRGTILAQNHPEHLYVTFGTEKVVLIKKRISVYVMEEKQLVPFIDGFLMQHSKQIMTSDI